MCALQAEVITIHQSIALSGDLSSAVHRVRSRPTPTSKKTFEDKSAEEMKHVEDKSTETPDSSEAECSRGG